MYTIFSDYLKQILHYLNKLNDTYKILLSIIYFFLLFYSRFHFIHIILAIVSIIFIILSILSQNPHTSFIFLEIMFLISWFITVKNQKKVLIISSQYLSSICIGSLMVLIFFFAANFVLQLFSLQEKYHYPILSQIDQIMLIIGAILCIGATPFVRWIVYGYSNLKVFEQVIAYILPSFGVMLFLFQNITYAKYTMSIIGLTIAIYANLCLLFEQKIRNISIDIIAYAYGNMLFLYSLTSYKYSCIATWLIFALLFSSFIFFFQQHKIKYISDLQHFNDSVLGKIIFIIYMIAILLPIFMNWKIDKYSLHFANINIISMMKIIMLILYGIFLNRILITIVQFEYNSKEKIYKTIYAIINYILHLLVTLFLLLLTLSLLFSYNVVFVFLKIKDYLVFSKEQLLINIIIVFTSMILLLPFISSINLIIKKHKITSISIGYIYYKIMRGIRQFTKISIQFVFSVCKDYIRNIKSEKDIFIQHLAGSSKTEGVLINKFHFFIFFIVILIFSLIIECIIKK